MREHVNSCQIPALVHGKRFDMLREMAKMISGRCDPIHLLELVDQELAMPPEAQISDQLHQDMEALRSVAGWRPPPRGFTLVPFSNSPACLLHWRSCPLFLGTKSGTKG